jgi:hypothetical protein
MRVLQGSVNYMLRGTHRAAVQASREHVPELVERNRIDCGRTPEAEVTTTLCLHHTAVARREPA